MRSMLLLGLSVLSIASPAFAAETALAAPPAAASVHDLQTVVVSGIQPGPGLWKVSKGEHVLWILGTVSPLPKKMEWYSPKTEAVLRETEEIIGQPGIVANVGVGGMFKMAFAMPTMLRARKNPDGKTLRDVLPADLYARWVVLKAMYLGKDKSVEEWRPIFAAGELYGAALERAGLSYDGGIGKRIGKLEEEHKIKRTSTLIKHEIKEPKRLAKSFAKAEIDDIACFRSMLDRLEADVANAAAQANAWAVGDIQELRRLIARDDMKSCFKAIAETEVARSMGMDTAYQRSEAQWLAAADAALSANRSSFAVLSVRKLLDPNGPLASLQAKGYSVLPPE